MSGRSLACLLLILSGCGPADRSPPAPEPPPPRTALWVLAEGTHRTLEAPERVERLVASAVRLGVSDLFVQVFRGGRSWFPSRTADESPYRALRRDGAPSPLASLLAQAHLRGLRVHAWFNTLSLARNRDAPLLERLGPEAVLVDRAGRSLLDYPGLEVPQPDRLHLRMGTPGIWLDPAVPGVVEELEATLDDLIAAAPDLDGLHLDFIRHPLALPITPGSRFSVGLDFGYGAASRDGFERESGQPFRRGEAWDDYRRRRVGDVVRRLAARVPAGWEVSAAVLPWADRAYLSAAQDWRGWLEEGWLDFAVAMAYMRDDRLLRYVARGLRGGVAGERVWIGLGSWLFADRPERIAAQTRIALDVEPAGVAFFSYDAIADLPAAQDAIRRAATGSNPEPGP